MPALKLFVSHSSRLDDVPHRYTRDDRNWRLLEDTCRAIRQKYGKRVEVLVDQDGLVPGDDWNHQLNLWLAECHVAIILFSRRAIEKSDWVAKEAAILSWRAELDEKFTLIPVMLDGESTPEDLAKDFLGALQIDRNQCIRNAQTADDILAGILRKIGAPEDLAGDYAQTPLERLQGGIAKLLRDETTSDSLQKALDDLECPVLPDGRSNHERYADLLARQLLTATAGKPLECFKLFQLGVDPLEPRPDRRWVNTLFNAIRSLWVDPRAAACIPLALRHRRPLLMAGNYVSTILPGLCRVTGYTLERYLERAWPGSNLFFDPITLTKFDTLEEMQDEIRRSVYNPMVASTNKGDDLDKWLNDDVKKIVVVATPPAKGELPDARQLAELSRLAATYERLIVILDTGAECRPLPTTIKAVTPPLDPRFEHEAVAKETLASQFVDRFGDP